jgi:DNA-binding ferritin-like protein
MIFGKKNIYNSKLNIFMERIASMFFHSRTQAHIFHTRVKGPGSFAAHTALQAYYEGIVPLIDGLVEGYQGQYGLIEYKEVNGVDNDASVENMVKYFDNLCKFLDKERKEPKLQMSWLQNDLDNVASLLYSTKYKLINLQ